MKLTALKERLLSGGFDSVLVHVFNPQSREYYNLERLWADGEEIAIDLED